jgi:hypothetical protein
VVWPLPLDVPPWLELLLWLDPLPLWLDVVWLELEVWDDPVLVFVLVFELVGTDGFHSGPMCAQGGPAVGKSQ